MAFETGFWVPQREPKSVADQVGSFGDGSVPQVMKICLHPKKLWKNQTYYIYNDVCIYIHIPIYIYTYTYIYILMHVNMY